MMDLWEMHRMDLDATITSSKDLLAWMNDTLRLKMLSVRKKSKLKKQRLGFTGVTSESVSDEDNRVIMICEDIPSEGSSRDSGRGSQSSGARSSSNELGHGRRSHTFHGREGQSMSSYSKPTKQYSVREIRHGESSLGFGQNGSHSTPRVRELYESNPTVVFLYNCICPLSIIISSAGVCIAHLNFWIW